MDRKLLEAIKTIMRDPEVNVLFAHPELEAYTTVEIVTRGINRTGATTCPVDEKSMVLIIPGIDAYTLYGGGVE